FIYTNAVTCGSIIKLVNTDYDVRLHSHDVNYGSGSGQQSVTGLKDVTDAGSYWQDKNTDYCRGLPIKCGQIIRLTHLSSKKNLHSHHFQSPLSRNFEVSAFGQNGIGDEGDYSSFLSQSVITGKSFGMLVMLADNCFYYVRYLHVSGSTFSHPIPGHFEISSSKSVYGSSWKTKEGVFIQPSEDSKTQYEPRHEDL
ncbi:unnamed protein product, partial [Mesocestoides corti]